jgi:hypothetical protein
VHNNGLVYYNKIDESGAYAAATLLHPNKRKAYVRAAWRPKWIKPGLRRAEELWTKKYEKYEKLEVFGYAANLIQGIELRVEFAGGAIRYLEVTSKKSRSARQRFFGLI